MLYCCEECGKKYSTEEDAITCEKKHAEEKAKREEVAKERDKRFKEIESDYKTLNDKVLQYHKDYGEYPFVKPIDTERFKMFDAIIPLIF